MKSRPFRRQNSVRKHLGDYGFWNPGGRQMNGPVLQNQYEVHIFCCVIVFGHEQKFPFSVVLRLFSPLSCPQELSAFLLLGCLLKRKKRHQNNALRA